ncbi:MAG: hypothetical protein PHQ23_05755 [Candidatus Wallbacteria bacterium]|nr:hypothetical protein [Candidatus Wallbacteria bacterium]
MSGKVIFTILLILFVLMMVFLKPTNVGEKNHILSGGALTVETPVAYSDWKIQKLERLPVRDIFLKPGAATGKDVIHSAVPIRSSSTVRPVLTGVFIGDGRYFAVINGEIYTQGEMVLGRIIRKIESGCVIFDNNEKLALE